MNKIVKTSIVLETIVYMLVALVGYLSLGDKYIVELLFLRKPYPGKNKLYEFIFQIAICSFFLIQVLSIGMYNPTYRDYIFDNLGLNDNRHNYLLVSLLPMVLFSVIAFYFHSISACYSFLGSTICNFDGYILPALLSLAVIW